MFTFSFKRCLVLVSIVFLGLFSISCNSDKVAKKYAGTYIREDLLKAQGAMAHILLGHVTGSGIKLNEDGSYIAGFPGRWVKRGNKIILIGRFDGRRVLKIDGDMNQGGKVEKLRRLFGFEFPSLFWKILRC